MPSLWRVAHRAWVLRVNNRPILRTLPRPSFETPSRARRRIAPPEWREQVLFCRRNWALLAGAERQLISSLPFCETYSRGLPDLYRVQREGHSAEMVLQ